MKKKDYLLIGGLFIIILISFIWINLSQGKPSTIAKVYHINDVVIEVDFSKNTYQLYPQKVDNNYPKLIEPLSKEGADLAFVMLGDFFIGDRRTELIIEVDFDTKSIRIERDETPKQIGVNRNWYNGKGLPVVSLPNKVSIRFEQTNDDLDGVI
ncbi:NusG domain II-containing protein [Acholeplasma hippikon]|nr:NusG domain II-containing protein [Acholeplasma hippikon]